MGKVALCLSVVLFLPVSVYAAMAGADIQGTAPDSQVTGSTTLEDTAGGLLVKVRVSGVPSGQHGIHIHEIGNCADLGNKAGGHYNPTGAKHGFIQTDGLKGAHIGDMGNIEIGPEGTGVLTMVIPELTIAGGQYNVAGRAIILHEKQDDFGQPTGNAGARIGCGLIQAEAEPETPAQI